MNIYDKVKLSFAKRIADNDKLPVLMDTADCIIHMLNQDLKSPKNCSGCKGEIQCTKLTAIMMIVYVTSFTNDAYPEAIKKFMERIINSKSIEELKIISREFLNEV